MSLPAFREDGWLPDRHHTCDWPDIVEHFGGATDTRRERLLCLLLEWRDAVRALGMGGLLILNGSFISSKPEPGDFDCLFVYDDKTAQLIEKSDEALELLNYDHCKEKGYGDIFALSEAAVRQFPTFCRTDMFDTEKVTKRSKGVLEVQI